MRKTRGIATKKTSKPKKLKPKAKPRKKPSAEKPKAKPGKKPKAKPRKKPRRKTPSTDKATKRKRVSGSRVAGKRKRVVAKRAPAKTVRKKKVSSRAKGKKKPKRKKKTKALELVEAKERELASELKAKERQLAELTEYKRLSEIDKRRRERKYVEVLSVRDWRVSPAHRAPSSNVFIIHAAEPKGFVEGDETEESTRYMVSGHANRGFKNYASAFERTFVSAVRKTGFVDFDDAPFFRFGVMFRVRLLTDLGDAIRGLSKWLNTNMPEGSSAHIIVEDKALSIRINLGDYSEASNATYAVQELKEKKSFIDSAMDEARHYTSSQEDFLWFPFWDWDELEPY